jgi:hypothetical protein
MCVHGQTLVLDFDDNTFTKRQAERSLYLVGSSGSSYITQT